MSHLADYFSTPIDLVDGEGCHVIDTSGKRYLDFHAGWGVGNVGWKNSQIIQAIQVEAERGLYVPPTYRFSLWEEFASILAEHAPNEKLTRVFRCTSGSEAIEVAIRCARVATGKKGIVSIQNVYHGHTYGAASVGVACDDSPAMSPGIPGCEKIRQPNPYREVHAREITNSFEALVEKNDDIAAFISEPIFTNSGAIIPPTDFFTRIQDICIRHGIIFIMDEVATGFGRCGRLFGSEVWGLKPDIVCLGKGITGGYGTLGATLVTEQIYEQCRGRVPSYSTFGWNPLDLAAARANVDFILDNRLWEAAHNTGLYLLKRLKLLERNPHVGEVRGIGLLLGIEIVRDAVSKQADFKRSGEAQRSCYEQGLLVGIAGNVLIVTPALNLTNRLADEGAAILEASLS